MRPIAATFEELCDEWVAALDLSLEERAVGRAERALAERLRGRTILVEGTPCVARVVSGAIALVGPGRPTRVIRLDDAAAAAIAARALELPPEAESWIEVVRRGRARRRLLLERERLVRERRKIARRRASLARLTEAEVIEAERLRRRLLARERRRGALPEEALARPVPEIVARAARALAEEGHAADQALGRASAALAEAGSARTSEDAAFLDGFLVLARLLAERIALEYRRFERALLRDLKSYAAGRPEGGADVPLPAATRASRAPPGARRLLARLAFLMTKANFVPVPQADLERGFEIGPAPGVRLHVPPAEPGTAYFFARGVRLEPSPKSGPVPRFERFAFCAIERPESARPRRRRPRKGPLATLVRRLRVALFRHARRRLEPSVRRAVSLVKELAAAPVTRARGAAPPIAVKVFEDVGLGECGLLLPGATIRYRFRDLILVGFGALGGVWTKLSQSPLALLLTPRIAFPIFLVAAFRGLMGMRRSRVTLDKLREEYENRRLLATRAHAADFFLREGAEADAKEALAAYATALLAAVETDRPEADPLLERPEGLRARVEARLSARSEVLVRFDLEDAIGSLEAMGLVAPPGFFAPGEDAVDYFDPRVTGETVRREAETLFEETEAPAPAAEPPVAAPPLPDAAPDARPAADAASMPPTVAFLPLLPALARLRRDLRRRLDLDDVPLGSGPPHAAPAEVEWGLGERFTL